MVIAVADLDGTLIGLRRMTDSTVFSVDVAATKARNMVYFNSASRTAADLNQVPMGTAVTNRTIGFGAQPSSLRASTEAALAHFSIYICKTWPIRARKDSKQGHRTRIAAASCFFQAVWGCIAMECWWADWA